MNDRDAMGVLILILGSAILMGGFMLLSLDVQLKQSKLETFQNLPENAKPIWCDEFNKCYIMDKWMDITNVTNKEPYTFVVVDGFQVEEVTIEKIRIE